MFRFLAVIWKPSHTQQCVAAKRVLQRIRASRTEWELAYDADGLSAFQAGSRMGKAPCALAAGSGVILGDVFTGDDIVNTRRLASNVDERLTRHIVNSECRYIVDNYWGSYVGFIRADGGDDVHVVCAPASAMPCLFLRFGEITVFFSRTEDCLELIPTEFSTNWDFVVRFMLGRGDRFIQGTGLTEVSRVLPGECLRIGDGAATRKLYWDPVQIATGEPIEDHKQAGQAIKATTQGCISAWASCHKRIVLKLSGGLDSSILLHCLASTPNRPEIQCLNFVTPSEEGDEREFARMISAAKEAPLHEVYRDIRKIKLNSGAKIELTALPSSFLGRLFDSGFESDFAKTHGASAYFTGNLGDELFLEGAMEHMAADHVWHHGVSRQLFRIAHHEARARQRTIWETLSDALTTRRKSMPLPLYTELLESNSYLSKDVLSSLTPHSLLPAVVGNIEAVPPGKRTQLLLCLPSLNYYDPLGDLEQPDNVAPLFSQPLLELCFRIPTYVMNAGGVGRALVRETFKNDLPKQIIRRRIKGTSTDMHLEALKSNYDVLREMLLGGLLIQEGIVDRRYLERCLKSPEALTVDISSQLPILYSTEAWLRSWASIPTAKHAVA